MLLFEFTEALEAMQATKKTPSCVHFRWTFSDMRICLHFCECVSNHNTRCLSINWLWIFRYIAHWKFYEKLWKAALYDPLCKDVCLFFCQELEQEEEFEALCGNSRVWQTIWLHFTTIRRVNKADFFFLQGHHGSKVLHNGASSSFSCCVCEWWPMRENSNTHLHTCTNTEAHTWFQ